MNIPDYRLDVIDAGQSVLTMKVVVGRPTRKTPVFDDAITHLVFNPMWHVPRRIALYDKLPRIQKDPQYLTQQGMTLFKGAGEDVIEVDPTTVDWSAVTTDTFDYRLVQRPGRGNALGDVKFIFPNPHDVYLHDTSERHLFRRATRAYSSGCIRVEKPIELAEYLLRATPEWTRERIVATIQEGTQHAINLSQPFPIRIVYRTTWVDAEGILQFREDMYQYDRREGKKVCQKAISTSAHLLEPAK